MSRMLARALPLASKSPPITAVHSRSFCPSPAFSPCSSISHRSFHVSSQNPNHHRTLAGIFFRKLTRRRAAAKKQSSKEKQLELNVSICIEEEMPDDPEVLNIAEILRLNVPMAMKITFDGLKDSEYKTRDTSIDDVGKFEKVELSVLLCNDDFIRKLNKDWRDEDHATDVLSMSQHVPELQLPILMLGDIVISVETAARQAKERGHTLLVEIPILMVGSAVFLTWLSCVVIITIICSIFHIYSTCSLLY
ncbi:endoribonuclease YBEY, chloroplastic-like [Magnolia sinica]|uniref:endoribonuclease YBEY, chloroplastic-like n=1 Tax=Magnolia sinica TaxID=86752 RepID=UPI00265944BB|nr:endoribonuclease YBEY, chloroplastic-like [Magnolia sinica]